MSNMEKEGKKRKFTTGEIRGITLVGASSLYRYVRDFPKFFSFTAKQHIKGRRWNQEDLEMIHAIRSLYHDRTGKEKIREMIKGGWRLQDNEAWTRELQSRLIEMTYAAYADAKEISKQAINAIDDLQMKTSVAEYNNEQFSKLWILVMDLQDEWRALEYEMEIRGRVRKSFKPRWHGEPPTLYLTPVEGSLKEFKVEDAEDTPTSPAKKKN
jgi:hypothetical protein